MGKNQDKEENIIIERNSYGEGDKEVSLYFDEDESISITISEQEYTKEELEEAFAEGFRYARNHMLQANESGAEIRSDLNFMTEIPGGLTAEWISYNQELLGPDGTLHNDTMSETEEMQVRVSLFLSYQEEIRMEDIYLMIKGPILSEKEKVQREIQTVIENIESSSRQENAVTIPAVIEGVELSTTPGTNSTGIILIIIPAVLLVIFQRRIKERESEEKRQKQLLEEYPIVVNKLILYLGSGLNLKMAFGLMLSEYQNQRQMSSDGLQVNKNIVERNFRKNQYHKEKKVESYVEQELFVMMNELKSGVSERAAYEAFGRRIREGSYIRLMALLIQNYQKGNEGLLKVLAQEEEEAFRGRIDRAKKAGEEAGTKLLFPMLLLLIIVMVIVMAPAIFQFQNY